MFGSAVMASSKGRFCQSSFSCYSGSIEDSTAGSYYDCDSSIGVGVTSRAVTGLEVIIIKDSIEWSISVVVVTSFIIDSSVAIVITITIGALLNFINCK